MGSEAAFDEAPEFVRSMPQALRARGLDLAESLLSAAKSQRQSVMVVVRKSD
jgi:hypothetical protein